MMRMLMMIIVMTQVCCIFPDLRWWNSRLHSSRTVPADMLDWPTQQTVPDRRHCPEYYAWRGFPFRWSEKHLLPGEGTALFCKTCSSTCGEAHTYFGCGHSGTFADHEIMVWKRGLFLSEELIYIRGGHSLSEKLIYIRGGHSLSEKLIYVRGGHSRGWCVVRVFLHRHQGYM